MTVIDFVTSLNSEKKKRKKKKEKSKQIKGRESIQRSHLYLGAAVLQTVSIGIGVFSFSGGWL